MALPVRVERGPTIDPLDIVRRDMSQLLGHVLGRGFFNDIGDGGTLSALTSYGVDIREDADHIYVEADLPGFRKEDVDISLQDGVLGITAERREEISEPDSGKEGEGAEAGKSKSGRPQTSRSPDEYLLRERRIQRFVRSFTLPPNVDPQSVQAKMENGVLRVTLNKREESKSRRVEVS